MRYQLVVVDQLFFNSLCVPPWCTGLKSPMHHRTSQRQSGLECTALWACRSPSSATVSCTLNSLQIVSAEFPHVNMNWIRAALVSFHCSVICPVILERTVVRGDLLQYSIGGRGVPLVVQSQITHRGCVVLLFRSTRCWMQSLCSKGIAFGFNKMHYRQMLMHCLNA